MTTEETPFDKTLRSIESRPDAKEALRVLEAAGCPRTPVVMALYFHRGPIPKVRGQKIDVAARDVKEIIARTPKMARQLRDDADELDALLKRLAETTRYEMHPRLPGDMRETALILEKLVALYRGKRFTVSGRNSSLAYLVHVVTEVTGKRHYEEIATLVSAVQQDPQGERVPTAQSIERKFLRFESSDSLQNTLLRGQAISDLQELKTKPSKHPTRR